MKFNKLLEEIKDDIFKPASKEDQKVRPELYQTKREEQRKQRTERIAFFTQEEIVEKVKPDILKALSDYTGLKAEIDADATSWRSSFYVKFITPTGITIGDSWHINFSQFTDNFSVSGSSSNEIAKKDKDNFGFNPNLEKYK